MEKSPAYQADLPEYHHAAVVEAPQAQAQAQPPIPEITTTQYPITETPQAPDAGVPITETPQAPDSGIQTREPKKQAEMQMGGPRTLQNSKGLPLDGNGERAWNHGLFGCCDEPGTCLLAWCCPCIVFGENHSRVEALKTTGRPHPQDGETCGTQTILSCLVWYLTGCGWIFQFMLRGDSRKRYNIKGSAGADCATSWCCGPCEQTQLRREIQDEEQAIMQGFV